MSSYTLHYFETIVHISTVRVQLIANEDTLQGFKWHGQDFFYNFEINLRSNFTTIFRIKDTGNLARLLVSYKFA